MQIPEPPPGKAEAVPLLKDPENVKSPGEVGKPLTPSLSPEGKSKTAEVCSQRTGLANSVVLLSLCPL